MTAAAALKQYVATPFTSIVSTLIGGFFIIMMLFFSILVVNPHNTQFQTLSVRARFMYIFELAICMKLASDLLAVAVANYLTVF